MTKFANNALKFWNIMQMITKHDEISQKFENVGKLRTKTENYGQKLKITDNTKQ